MNRNLRITFDFLPMYQANLLVDYESERAYMENVCMLFQKVLEATKEKYYTYESIAKYVAELTKSTVKCDEENNTFTFSYVAI